MVVIDKGEIAEMGTHEELLQKNGVYKRLVLRQLTAGSINSAPSTSEGSSGDMATQQANAHLHVGSIQSQGSANEPVV